MLHLLFAAAVASAACPSSDDACVRASMEQGLKLNDLTAVGTHNSYKQSLPAQELAVMVAAAGQRALGIDYGHRPLTDQLNDGARQLEIDIAQDAAGGLYAKPKTATGQGELLSPANAAIMAKPGYKVLHMQDVDFRSTCLTFVACLGEVRAWSKANPTHAPILILINAKEGGPNLPGGVIAPTYDAKAFDALDAEIRSVFSEAELITPDQVQGKKPTLREAVLAGGWPTLGAARGKVFFALDESTEKVAVYRGARRSLEGRAMFVNTDEASPAAAYLTLNDPIAEQARIQAAVKAGFVVRTRADADTWEARANDPRRRSAAFSSGAQYVSTDYMRPDPRFAGGYFARLPGGAAAVCNTVRAADQCRGLAIEAEKGAPVRGYLAPAERPDLTVVMAQPPAPGSPKALADAAIFRDTRALQGTARWALATSDVNGHMYDHFAAALGVRIRPEQAPILTALLDRSGDDRSVVGVAKTHWGTKRPYLGTDLPICEAKSDHLAGNPDYPSGHSAHGMHVGLILAELAPQRKTELLARGREYAESRYICGAHSYSAAEAGIIGGMAIFAAEHASPLFRQDMDAARAEVAAALSGAGL
ncbi:Ca2+-dependent phosphoinositide-specific phospholipase C [Caulobacter sp. NIBR2454]|uniref:Ca2+-dependent phosphoinositide-specific phospholipase C n=1 Tax=Caulobacter sp. NIBR2454 TaxID=3015996 RepID=UPI0022B64BF4|nr:Ca2+-dependent phosphoinositide-specific phospholipase C [Caulobacter sp. NIBR2454]